MFFGLSWSETVVVVVVGAVLIGPKDIVVVARTAGRLSGHAAGYLAEARSLLSSISEKAKVNEIHAELRETLSQVEAIKQDLSSGMSLMQRTTYRYNSGAEAEAKQPNKEEEVLTKKNNQFESSTISHLAVPHRTREPFQNAVKPLPVSAAAAGLLPKRKSEHVNAGSGLLFDALMEERVAYDALKFAHLKDMFEKEDDKFES